MGAGRGAPGEEGRRARRAGSIGSATTSGPGGVMTVDAHALVEQVRTFLQDNDPATMEPAAFLGARYDAGLAWVSFPSGLGGQSAPRSLQAVVDAELAAGGAPSVNVEKLGIGLGMAAPTILA